MQRLEDSGCLYAVCQGAIGVECREDDKETLSLLDAITDRETMLQCVTERSFIKHLVHLIRFLSTIPIKL